MLVGNVWGRSWLEMLRRTVRGAGLQVDWFCNAPGAGWLNVEASELLDDGIRLVDPLPEQDLARRLGEYEVALVPSAPAVGQGENWGVASLSLPTRIPFLIGASNLPIIVLGDARTCAARFVTHFGIGAACDYDPDLLATVLETVAGASWRESQGQSLAQLRDTLDGEGWEGWLRGAIDSGRPPSLRFESLQVLPPLTVTGYIDDSPTLHRAALRGLRALPRRVPAGR